MIDAAKPVRAKCLGCHEVAIRTEYEETASVDLVRIRCGTCGAKRVAKVIYGDIAEAAPSPPTVVPAGPTREEELDLLAEAHRIFGTEPTASEVAATAAAIVDDESGMATLEPESLIDAAYRAWLRTVDGGTVARAIRDRAKALVDRGWTHYGIAALFEAARFDRDLDVGPDADGWKLNNNFRSRLARDLMAKYPELAGFFETRALADEREAK